MLKAVTELGLSTDIVEVLQRKGVKDYELLCCCTLGQLTDWGLKPDQLRAIQRVIRNVRK